MKALCVFSVLLFLAHVTFGGVLFQFKDRILGMFFLRLSGEAKAIKKIVIRANAICSSCVGSQPLDEGIPSMNRRVNPYQNSNSR
jgi:hypothetical protein